MSACADTDDSGEFDPVKASLRWSSAEMSWDETELRALEQGRILYRRNCAACHGKNGGGDNTIGAPSLIDNAIIKGDIDYHIALIKNGKNQMPTFARILTADEILYIAAFERNAWGNHDYQVFAVAGD